MKMLPTYIYIYLFLQHQMKTYTKNGFEFFYDRNQKQWVCYPVDSLGNRIEWDKNDNPIEVMYFNNKKELNKFI